MQYEHHMVLDLLKQGHPNADQKVWPLHLPHKGEMEWVTNLYASSLYALDQLNTSALTGRSGISQPHAEEQRRSKPCGMV